MDPVTLRRGHAVAQSAVRFAPVVYTLLSLISPGKIMKYIRI